MLSSHSLVARYSMRLISRNQSMPTAELQFPATRDVRPSLASTTKALVHEPVLSKILVLLWITAVALPVARAVPSYSRQTGLACSSCHYTPPELNAFSPQF